MKRRDMVEQKRERGAIAALAGIFMLVLAGMTVVGVDVGRLAFTASEVQTVAEVAATGYANAWLGELVDGTTHSYETEALGSISGNSIDGKAATAANIQGYERGIFDFNSYTFTPGGAASDQNAVRATATATVNNFFASLFGTPSTTVVKTATATLTCGDRARPLPLAVQDCQFDAFEGPDDCSELPQLTEQNVSVDNACWTNLNGSSFNIVPYINYICNLGGNTTIPPAVKEGDIVDVNEGSHTSACQAIRDCWDAGVKTFTVPIIACRGGNAVQCASQGTNNLEISGFANIELSARPTCGTSSKTIPLHSFCNTDPTEGVNGNCEFGLSKVAMVQ